MSVVWEDGLVVWEDVVVEVLPWVVKDVWAGVVLDGRGGLALDVRGVDVLDSWGGAVVDGWGGVIVDALRVDSELIDDPNREPEAEGIGVVAKAVVVDVCKKKKRVEAISPCPVPIFKVPVDKIDAAVRSVCGATIVAMGTPAASSGTTAQARSPLSEDKGSQKTGAQNASSEDPNTSQNLHPCGAHDPLCYGSLTWQRNHGVKCFNILLPTGSCEYVPQLKATVGLFDVFDEMVTG